MRWMALAKVLQRMKRKKKRIKYFCDLELDWVHS